MDNRHVRAGEVALAALDRILDAAPHPDQHLFSQATHCLCVFRNALFDDYRPGRPDARQQRELDHVNAVVSLLMAAHFPLGDVPWPELRMARGWLADAIAGERAPALPG